MARHRVLLWLGSFLCAATLEAQVNPPPGMHTGTVIKYSQPIDHLINPNWPNQMENWGENIWSDVDWQKIMQSPTAPPNWTIADDFRDEFDLPVVTVRWWGSYAPQDPAGAPPRVIQRDVTGQPIPIPVGPGVEDGYLISFFRDIPDPDGDRNNPQGFSRPGELLGSYVIPWESIRVKETPYQGWDMHPIFEYEADLWSGHLDHGSDLARPKGFFQRPGEVYWLSIAAEVGHRVQRIADPAGGDGWISIHTGKEALEHYWGWHTSPIEFNDLATMGSLFMPGAEWQYVNWQPVMPQHRLSDMAFELLTIPEPTSIALAVFGAIAMAGIRRR